MTPARSRDPVATAQAAPDRLAAALGAVARGWPVFPLRPYSKLPAVRNWEQRASTDPDRLQAWWAGNPSSNVGVACGPAELVVVDLDAAGHTWPDSGDYPDGIAGIHGHRVLAALAAAAGEPIPDTYSVATPSGQHLYFTGPGDVQLRNTAGFLGTRIDTRAAGGYVVAAGSVLSVGGNVRRYRVTRDVQAVRLPGWMSALLSRTPRPAAVRVEDSGPGPGLGEMESARTRAYVAAAVAGESRAVADAVPGTRNHTLFRAAANLGELLGAGLLDEDVAAHALLAAAARHVGVEGFTAGEARRAIRNGLRRGRHRPRHVPR